MAVGPGWLSRGLGRKKAVVVTLAKIDEACQSNSCPPPISGGIANCLSRGAVAEDRVQVISLDERAPRPIVRLLRGRVISRRGRARANARAPKAKKSAPAAPRKRPKNRRPRRQGGCVCVSLARRQGVHVFFRSIFWPRRALHGVARQRRGPSAKTDSAR